MARTKAALAVKKARGVRLGRPAHPDERDAMKDPLRAADASWPTEEELAHPGRRSDDGDRRQVTRTTPGRRISDIYRAHGRTVPDCEPGCSCRGKARS